MLRLAFLAARHVMPGILGLPRQAALALGEGIKKDDPRPSRLWKALALVMPIALLVGLTLPRLTLVMSPSIDAWLLRRAPGPITKGDLVQFTLVHPLAGPKPVSVTKRALCLPGEMLKAVERPSRMGRGLTDGYYYCNGALLGVSRPFGRDGRKLEHLRWGDRPLPDDFIYVGSDHTQGFDSRYYGPIGIDRLTRMERIL